MSQEFSTFVNRMQMLPNHCAPSPYDTAWMAWLYSESREWLIDTQRPDGSWGAELEYFHDRVTATLAAMNAIAATSTNGHDLKRLQRGIRYVERAIPQLSKDVFETVSFELLLPGLVKIGKSLGLKYDLIEESIEPFRPLYEQKLALIPEEMIYSPKIPLAHSLEFIGFDNLDLVAVENVRAINGSIHNSPGATAFVEVASGKSGRGREYLDTVAQRYNGTAPVHTPFELYEMIWSLHHLSLNVPLEDLRPAIDPFVQLLGHVWTDQGVGFSTLFVPDSDDTSLGLRLLHKLGINVDPRVLERFETESHFRCLPYERNLSLDAHIHIVHALKGVPHFPRRDDMLLKALNILGRYLTGDYIVDKWHVSPYYSTSHAIIGLIGLADNIIAKQIDWLLKTQREDGSWTFYPQVPKAAVEETAYALMALMTVYEHRGDIPREAIEKGYRYLADHRAPAEALPTLWIHKVLYSPYHIVDAAILSTLAKYRSLKWN